MEKQNKTKGPAGIFVGIALLIVLGFAGWCVGWYWHIRSIVVFGTLSGVAALGMFIRIFLISSASKSAPLLAQKRRWREFRADGSLGETLYKGLHMQTHYGEEVLVSELSHGLRVLALEGAKYQFSYMGIGRVIVTPDFVFEVTRAFDADRMFQHQKDEFNRLMDVELIFPSSEE